jgi:predicted DNA-binding protein YlxM (UPF0122 family)
MTKHRRKVGRPRKKPGEPVQHHLTPRVREAITLMVQDGLSIKEAAEKVGLTVRALYHAIKHEPVRQHYMAEVRALLTYAKHLAARTLIEKLNSENATASVSAARTLLADDAKPVPPAGMAQTPGFVFMIVDGRGGGQALPNGHPAPPMLEVRPAAPAIEPADDEADGYA